MDMSQALSSSGSAGLPRCGVSAARTACTGTANAQETTTATTSGLGMDIPYRTIGHDLPTLNRVVVINLAWHALRHQGRVRWLAIALLVGRAALQKCGFAVPVPGHPETARRLRQ